MRPDAVSPAQPQVAARWRLQSVLRRQLLVLLTALWLVVATAAGLALWRETADVLDSALEETAQRLLMLPAAALAEPDTAARLALLAPHTEVVVYQVFEGPALTLRSHAAPATPLDPGAPDGVRTAPPWHVLTLTSRDGSRRAQVAERTSHRLQALWAGVQWLVGALLVLLPMAALGLHWVLRRGFGSLERPRRELTQRAADDLAPLASADAPAELAPWLDAVNALLERVQRQLGAERALASNMAHELRTPLAAARAQAQRLVQVSHGPATREPAQALLRQLDRLTRLSTRLLELARVDAGQPLRRAPVDLAQLVLLVVDEFAEPLRQGRLVVGPHQAPQTVPGDIDALGIALRNLIDNALKHGQGTTVTVCAHGLAVRVSDTGPGVAPQRLAGLVRRFDRGAQTGNLLGTGVGLAIVDTIARQSGGHLRLRSPLADGPGFCATLDLSPAAVDPGSSG